MNTIPDALSVAEYLLNHPRFFDEHDALLACMEVISPRTGRAVSLVQRQMEVMRKKHAAIESSLAQLISQANENAAIADKFLGWTRALLQERKPARRPDTLISSLQERFDVPQASLRLWHLAPEYLEHWFGAEVSGDLRLFADSLHMPYCGSNHDFEAVRWLNSGAAIASVAILPLRAPGDAGSFGLLVLGSPDPERFTAAMATDFLRNFGASASAALSILQEGFAADFVQR